MTSSANQALPELSPCPHCGGAVAPYGPDDRSETRYAASIVCHHCGTSFQMANHDSDKNTVAHAWNRRALPTGDGERVEARQGGVASILARAEVRHALEIASMGRPYSDVQGHLYMNERYKSRPGSDAQFTDYGLAHAACVLFNVAADILTALEDRPAVPAGEAVATEVQAAYGLLWRMHTTDQTIHAARRALLETIGKEGQRAGITWARNTFGPTPEPRMEDLP